MRIDLICDSHSAFVTCVPSRLAPSQTQQNPSSNALHTTGVPVSSPSRWMCERVASPKAVAGSPATGGAAAAAEEEEEEAAVADAPDAAGAALDAAASAAAAEGAAGCSFVAAESAVAAAAGALMSGLAWSCSCVVGHTVPRRAGTSLTEATTGAALPSRMRRRGGRRASKDPTQRKRQHTGVGHCVCAGLRRLRRCMHPLTGALHACPAAAPSVASHLPASGSLLDVTRDRPVQTARRSSGRRRRGRRGEQQQRRWRGRQQRTGVARGPRSSHRSWWSSRLVSNAAARLEGAGTVHARVSGDTRRKHLLACLHGADQM